MLPHLPGVPHLHVNRPSERLEKVLLHTWRHARDISTVSSFLAWGDFQARSRFACSTIPEEKWALLEVKTNPAAVELFRYVSCFLTLLEICISAGHVREHALLGCASTLYPTGFYADKKSYPLDSKKHPIKLRVSNMWLYFKIGEAQLYPFMETARKSPLLYVNRSAKQYGSRGSARAIRYNVNMALEQMSPGPRRSNDDD